MNYTTTDVAAALGATTKMVDNLLAREAKHLLSTGKRGRSRLIDESLIEILAIALLLRRDLGTSARTSVKLASGIAASPVSNVAVGTLGVLHFDVASLRLVLRQALADSLEERRPVRRGRPLLGAQRGTSL